MYLAKLPVLVWTVLGSCLGIVFHSRRLKIGAIAHAQLPCPKLEDIQCSVSCAEKCEKELPNPESFQYVSCSIHHMIERFLRLGIHRDEIDVKIFGGANVISHDPNSKTVGKQNIENALALIKELHLNLVSQNTGGTIGRTIYFCTDTGKVFHRHHRGVSNV